MTFSLLNLEGLMFVFRWIHFFAGVTWIGMLYYFNFVQGAFFGETDAATKSNCVQKLVPRALWWFRWGAMFTFFSGLLILGLKGHTAGFEIYATSWGVSILMGAALGALMWANVWFVIWPARKVVIQSAVQAASGGKPIPEAAAIGARAGVASRHNVLFSIPMLFFMGAASHLPVEISATAHLGLLALVFILVLVLLELNALKGKLGILTSIPGVIHSGVALTVLLYILLELLTK